MLQRANQGHNRPACTPEPGLSRTIDESVSAHRGDRARRGPPGKRELPMVRALIAHFAEVISPMPGAMPVEDVPAAQQALMVSAAGRRRRPHHRRHTRHSYIGQLPLRAPRHSPTTTAQPRRESLSWLRSRGRQPVQAAARGPSARRDRHRRRLSGRRAGFGRRTRRGARGAAASLLYRSRLATA